MLQFSPFDPTSPRHVLFQQGHLASLLPSCAPVISTTLCSNISEVYQNSILYERSRSSKLTALYLSISRQIWESALLLSQGTLCQE
jgi:hypothetical protein